MGKDYKTGLVSGLVLAMAALIWIATRPSLSPEARMLRPPQASARQPGPSPIDQASVPTGRDDSSPKPDASPGSTLDSQSRSADVPYAGPSGPASDPRSATGDPQSGGPDLTIYEKAEKIKTTRFHILCRNETLSSVSRQYYGTPGKWQKILNANKSIIKDPNKLQPGTKLIIPE